MTIQKLQLLGAVQVTWQRGEPPRFRSERTKVLLGYLVAERRTFTRDALAGLFWPDEPAATGRANLRRELHNLANLLPSCWQVDRKEVAFTPSAGTAVDLDMLRHLEAQEQWAQAAEVVRGEFLEGLYLEDNLEFETWLLGERERWRQRIERVLTRAAQVEKEQDNTSQARRHLARLLQFAPWHEEGHRQMMRLLAHGGQFSAALRQYEQCRDILATELAVLPSAATTTLYERIKLAMALPRHSLPPQATPFVGREEEMAALKRRLADPYCRLLTLTGVGGIGKSRLALEVARLAVAEDSRLFLHGVAFVPLTGVDREDLVAVIGGDLGITYSGRQPAERQLLTYLQDMEILLLLDNYEQLLPDTALLTSILREAPDTKLLVTSRERLHLQEEWLYELDGLPYPEAETADITGGEEPEYASVRLFTACARRAHRAAALVPSRGEVMAICHLVQGMPLALELSAARLNSLPPADVLAELKQGLDILATKTQNVSPRHTSLRATFDASWTGLSAREKKVLGRLSLFRSGFTRDAAEQAAGASLHVLSSLNDKSLIRLMPSGRYEMHGLLRHYAAEKLAAEPEVAAVAREQYAAYYGAFLQAREQRLLETHQEKTLKEVELEMDNIRPAWRWLVQNEKLALLDAAMWALFGFYLLRGQVGEGLALMEDTLAGVTGLKGRGKQERRLHARLHAFLGFFLYSVGRLVEGRRSTKRSLDLLRSGGTAQDTCLALVMLGQSSSELGKSGAIAHMKEGLALVRASGPRWIEAVAATRLADTLSLKKGEPSWLQSGRLLAEAMAIGQQLDNPYILFNALLVEGRLAIRRKDFRLAEQVLEQAVTAAQRIDDPRSMVLALRDLGAVVYLSGEFARASKHFSQGRVLARRIGARGFEADILNLMGETARVQGDFDQAIEHYQKTIALREELHGTRDRLWISCYCNLGHVLLRRSHVESAVAAFRNSLTGPLDGEDPTLVGLILAGLAGVLVVREKPEAAVRLAGAAAAGIESGQRPLEPADRQDWERIVAEIKEKLDEEAFATGWEVGRALSLEQAVALAWEKSGQRQEDTWAEDSV